MTINPLVVASIDQSADPWAGIWIAEDIELIAQGVREGSWIDGGLGVVSAGLDALAIVSDPIGVLLQYGVSWIIEHVEPLSQALDWLAGDPGRIAGHAQTWRNVATALSEQAGDLARAMRWDVAGWSGVAGSAYRAWSGQQHAAIAALAKAADTMAAITEGAGFLIAAVRVLVRDAIATCVSRLVVYAVEELASFGFATPLVVEQVTTTVAAWAAKIARMLRGLLSSLRELVPMVRRLGELIDQLKKILNRLRTGGGGASKRPPGHGTRQELLDELERRGVKHNPDEVVEIGRNDAGQIVFLENGNGRAGLQHITERHAADFARLGVPEDKIGRLSFSAVIEGRIVGMQRTRPIYEVVFEGRTYRVAVSVGDNGFIVGANPVGG